jgi:hypothetical protein
MCVGTLLVDRNETPLRILVYPKINTGMANPYFVSMKLRRGPTVDFLNWSCSHFFPETSAFVNTTILKFK